MSNLLENYLLIAKNICYHFLSTYYVPVIALCALYVLSLIAFISHNTVMCVYAKVCNFVYMVYA